MEERPRYAGRRAPRDDDLLSTAAVAALKGCSRSTVQLEIARGNLLGVPIIGVDGEPSGWAVRRGDAAAWTPRGRGWKKGRPRGPRAGRSSGG